MRTISKKIGIVSLAMMSLLLPALAEESHGHGGERFHKLNLEVGGGQTDKSAAVTAWDFHGWLGSDKNKLWLKAEGERENGQTEKSELWAMYSRNVTTFWDAQVGLKHDTQPSALSYFVMGVEGLAPYFLETEAHVFISEDADVSLRLHQETGFLLTQKLMLQPSIGMQLYAQDVPELEIAAGLSDAEIGLQLRYEFTRKFAPYIEVKYERKLGETLSIAKSNGEGADTVAGLLGVRLMF